MYFLAVAQKSLGTLDLDSCRVICAPSRADALQPSLAPRRARRGPAPAFRIQDVGVPRTPTSGNTSSLCSSCCRTWIRTKIPASKGRCPTIRRSGNVSHHIAFAAPGQIKKEKAAGGARGCTFSCRLGSSAITTIMWQNPAFWQKVYVREIPRTYFSRASSPQPLCLRERRVLYHRQIACLGHDLTKKPPAPGGESRRERVRNKMLLGYEIHESGGKQSNDCLTDEDHAQFAHPSLLGLVRNHN